MEPHVPKPSGYRATKTDKGLVIHDVEVFATCERDDFKADEKWLRAAFKKAQAEAKEDYHPPLHIRHHGDGQVIGVGTIRFNAVRSITLSGKQRPAIFCDYHVTDEQTAQDLIDGKFPYRSIEIFDVDAEPSIDGLALLDHEAPYLRLPLLMVSDVEDYRSLSGRLTAQATTPAMASFRAGHCVNPLRREELKMDAKSEEFGAGVTAEPVTTDTTFATADVPADGPLQFADDKPPIPPAATEGKPDAEGEDTKPAQIDAAAVIGAINDGSIPIGDFDGICEAIDARKAAAAQQPQQPQQQPQPPQAGAHVPPPGGATMKAELSENSAHFAAMQGEIDALKAQGAERDATDQRRSDVAEALQRLEGRPMGADLEERLEAFHREHGPAAFKAYIDSMAQTFGTAPDKDTPTAFHASALPECVMTYQDAGPGEVDRAAKFAQEHARLVRGGARMNVPVDRYVAINMRRRQEMEG